MGLMQLITVLFGGARNRPLEIIEALRPNAEALSQRGNDLDAATLAQLTAEFARPSRTWFDSIIDGLNRLPRPVITLGMIYVLVLAVHDPIRAAEVFTALAIIPSALWVLMSIVVTFFFGGRMQALDQDFNRDLAGAATALPGIMDQLSELQALRAPVEMAADTPLSADTGPDADATIEVVRPSENPALQAWLEDQRESERGA